MKHARAFTLIEMTITLAVFGLLMAALVGALFAGTRSWDRADGALVRGAALDVALKRWQADFERAWFEPKGELPVFESSAGEKQRAIVTIRTLGSARESMPAGGMAEVAWEVRSNADGALDWVRIARYSVAGRPVGEEVVEVVLPGVSGVEYRYLIDGAWAGEWQGGVPSAIQARVTMAGTPQAIAWKTARIVVGEPEP